MPYRTLSTEEEVSTEGTLNQIVSNHSQISDDTQQTDHLSHDGAITHFDMQEEAALAAYGASLMRFRTVNNDSNLFLTACSTGLSQILVKGLEDELRLRRIEDNGKPIDRSFWWCFGRSAINDWCDGCLEIFGAQTIYGRRSILDLLLPNRKPLLIDQ